MLLLVNVFDYDDVPFPAAGDAHLYESSVDALAVALVLKVDRAGKREEITRNGIARKKHSGRGQVDKTALVDRRSDPVISAEIVDIRGPSIASVHRNRYEDRALRPVHRE